MLIHKTILNSSWEKDTPIQLRFCRS